MAAAAPARQSAAWPHLQFVPLDAGSARAEFAAHLEHEVGKL